MYEHTYGLAMRDSTGEMEVVETPAQIDAFFRDMGLPTVVRSSSPMGPPERVEAGEAGGEVSLYQDGHGLLETNPSGDFAKNLYCT